MDLRIGVLRLGRMGDLVMTLPALRWIGAQPGLRPLLITDPRWWPLLPEIDTLVPEPGPEPLHALLDLHRVPASRRALRRLRSGGVGPIEPVHKESLRRRGLLVSASWPPRRTWPERHLAAAERLLGRLGRAPGPRSAAVPQLPPHADPEPGLLGLVPGAQHATKRWPLEHFADLAARWRRAQGRVRAFLGPDEADLAPPLAAAGAEIWPPALGRLREGLSACAVVVAGDTGPLHVAGALGRPVVALFGPTPRRAGFWVWGDRGTLLGLDLGCAPCSLHGSAACPRRHHRCLRDLGVERVLAAALVRATSPSPGARLPLVASPPAAPVTPRARPTPS